MVTPSTPGAPRFRRTSSQALNRMSLRATLSNRAWKRRSGCCLALRYSTRCKARDASKPSALAVDLASPGTHRSSPSSMRADEAGVLGPGGLCCPCRRRYYDPLRRPGGRPSLPVVSVIGGPASRAPQARGHRGPLQFPRHPSDHSTPPTPEGSWAPAPGSLVPSMAFATGIQARLPLGPLARGFLTTLQASLHAADRPVARPVSRGGLPPPRPRALARRRECCYRGPWRLPGPDSHRLAAVSLSLGYVVVLLLSVVLSARATGRTFRRNRGPDGLEGSTPACRSLGGKA